MTLSPVVAVVLAVVSLTLDCGTPTRPSTTNVTVTTIVQTPEPSPPRRCRKRGTQEP